jgi:thiol-disulfide isomerase/thioredoxin
MIPAVAGEKIYENITPVQNPVARLFMTQDLEGDSINDDYLSAYQLNMINIWATYCNPCLMEMPDLGKLNRDYHEHGFQIVGILTDAQDASLNIIDDKLSLAREIVDKTAADYFHILPSADMINAFLAQVTAIPCTFFLTGEGEIVGSVYYGSRSYNDWEQIIVPLLEEMTK